MVSVLDTSIGTIKMDDFIEGCIKETLPTGIQIFGKLFIDSYLNLVTLPEGLEIHGDLGICFCPSFKRLPNHIQIHGDLCLIGCGSFTTFPEDFYVQASILCLKCSSLSELPKEFNVKGELELCYCNFKTLPSDMKIGKYLTVEETFLENYPFREIPKILHLPFIDFCKEILIERLNK